MSEEFAPTGLMGVSDEAAPSSAPSGGSAPITAAEGAAKLAEMLRPTSAPLKSQQMGGEFQETQKQKPSPSYTQSQVTRDPAEGRRRLAALTGKTVAPPKPTPPPAHMPDGVERVQQQTTPPPQPGTTTGHQQPQVSPSEARRQELMKHPAFWDTKHPQHAEAVRVMNAIVYAEGLNESEAKGETFTNKELAADLESRFGVDRMPLTGIARAPEYDFHAANFLGAMASGGIEPELVQSIVKDFESHSVSGMGAHLDDGQLRVMYDRYALQLGKKLSDQLLTWYKTQIRGDRA